MLKIGDKLYCKKSINSLLFEKKYYKITELNNSIVYVNNWGFSIDKNYGWYLWNYFYTPQEIRKMKLIKIGKTNYKGIPYSSNEKLEKLKKCLK